MNMFKVFVWYLNEIQIGENSVIYHVSLFIVNIFISWKKTIRNKNRLKQPNK